MEIKKLYHPDNGAYYDAPASAVPMLAASGWVVCDEDTVARLDAEAAAASAAAEAAMRGDTGPSSAPDAAPDSDPDPAAGAATTPEEG